MKSYPLFFASPRRLALAGLLSSTGAPSWRNCWRARQETLSHGRPESRWHWAWDVDVAVVGTNGLLRDLAVASPQAAGQTPMVLGWDGHDPWPARLLARAEMADLEWLGRLRPAPFRPVAGLIWPDREDGADLAAIVRPAEKTTRLTHLFCRRLVLVSPIMATAKRHGLSSGGVCLEYASSRIRAIGSAAWRAASMAEAFHLMRDDIRKATDAEWLMKSA